MQFSASEKFSTDGGAGAPACPRTGEDTCATRPFHGFERAAGSGATALKSSRFKV
jgi:hypothetical protein